MCTYSGVLVDSEEMENSMTNIDSLFSADNCWTDLCTDIENIIEDTVSNGLNDLVNSVVSDISECAGIKLDPNSCIVSTSFDLILSQVSGDYYYGTTSSDYDEFNRKLFEKYYDDEALIEDICQAHGIGLDQLNDIISAAQYVCISGGDSLATNENAEEVKEALASILGADPCWSDLCEKLERDANDLMALMLNYVIDCTSIDLNSTSCSEDSLWDLLLSEFQSGSSRLLTTSQYINDTETQCMIPNLYHDGVEALVSMANETCTSNDILLSEEELDDLSNNFAAIFTSEKCWADLCSEDAVMMLVSNTIQECVDVDFPKSMTNPTEVALHPDNYIDDKRLACMIQFAMSSDEVSLGFNPPRENGNSCMPFAGVKGISGICSNIIGPASIDHCSATDEAIGDENFVWPIDASMSMSFSFDNSCASMSYPCAGDKTIELIDSMCHIFEAIVGVEGQKCLEPFCGLLTDAISTRESTSEPPQIESELDDDDDTSTSSSSAPSLSPVISSSSPSQEISLSPDPFGLAGVSTVEIKFEAGITLNNIRLSDIPTQKEDLTAMVRVLQSVISKFLPPGAFARILRIGSISVDRRLLRKLDDSEGVKVEFEVTMKSECDDNECVGAQAIADEMYEDVKETINGAVSSGDLTSAIKEEALVKGVEALSDVSIDENSFEAKEKLVKVEKKNLNNDDDAKGEDDNIDDSSSNFLHFRFQSLFLLVVLILDIPFI